MGLCFSFFIFPFYERPETQTRGQTCTRSTQLQLYCQRHDEQVNNGKQLWSIVCLAAIDISAATVGILR